MATQRASYPTLDHIVILVSYTTLSGLSDKLHGIFTVAPGGNHADGLTSNKLVIFEDGVYVEFIAFFDNVDPERRKKHRWGNLQENTIIDWAFAFPPGGDFGAIKQRVQDSNTGFRYQEPAPWARKRADGTLLEWTLSPPIDSSGRSVTGYIPFWVLDTTPRDLRVPYKTDTHLTDHPVRVRGVSSLSVSVPQEQASELEKVYGAIYGSPGLKEWPYEVPSGSTIGKHVVSLLGAEKMAVTITLSGFQKGQGRVEVLPGLVFNIE